MPAGAPSCGAVEANLLALMEEGGRAAAWCDPGILLGATPTALLGARPGSCLRERDSRHGAVPDLGTELAMAPVKESAMEPAARD